jgi:hypothetical protein
MRILPVIFLFFTMFSFSQDLERHQWKNRVLFIYTADKNSDVLENQFNILSKNKEALLERKLVIYAFTEDVFRFHFDEHWQKSEKLHQRYIHKKKSFKIFLLGLDGRIKLEQSSLLTAKKLFATIDEMQMRRREIRNKN